MSGLWEKLEGWLEKEPDTSWAEVSIGRSARCCVRLVRSHAIDAEHPGGDQVLADAESATLEGAVDGALLLAQEFEEGHS